jgi:hypothetical protein
MYLQNKAQAKKFENAKFILFGEEVTRIKVTNPETVLRSIFG